jgi:hypothetical protein
MIYKVFSEREEVLDLRSEVKLFYRNLTCENIIWSRPRAAPFTTPKADRAGGAASFRQNRDACRSAGDRGGLLGFA